MELRTGTVSERAESQRARRGFERVRISLTFKLCGAVTVSLFNLLVSDPWTWGEEGRICSDSPRPVWAGRPERGVACVCSPGERGGWCTRRGPFTRSEAQRQPRVPRSWPSLRPRGSRGRSDPGRTRRASAGGPAHAVFWAGRHRFSGHTCPRSLCHSLIRTLAHGQTVKGRLPSGRLALFSRDRGIPKSQFPESVDVLSAWRKPSAQTACDPPGPPRRRTAGEARQ